MNQTILIIINIRYSNANHPASPTSPSAGYITHMIAETKENKKHPKSNPHCFYNQIQVSTAPEQYFPELQIIIRLKMQENGSSVKLFSRFGVPSLGGHIGLADGSGTVAAQRQNRT